MIATSPDMETLDGRIEQLACALSVQGGLKLWSVIVTVLGDLTHHGIDELPGPVLTALVRRIGLQPQAMRVALHRLKRDGWVESRRDGRVSHHRLSATGHMLTDGVAARVYGHLTKPAGHLRIAVLPPGSDDATDNMPDIDAMLPVAPRVILVCGSDGDIPEDWIVADMMSGDQPAWFNERLKKEACESDFRHLEDALLELLQSGVPSNELDRWALRVLVLHGWRRLVLRSNPLAESLLDDMCAAARCREQVQALLAALKLPDAAFLSSVG